MFKNSAIKQKKSARFLAMFAVVTLLMVFTMSLGVFASPEPYVAVEAADLEPILAGATANLKVIIPVGIGLLAIIIGASFIPQMNGIFRRGR